MTQHIIGQILGFVATALMAMSYQVNKPRRLLLIQSAGTLCNCLSYLLLGATSGFALNIVCLIRNGYYAVKKEGTVTDRILTAVLVLAIIVVGALSWQGSISLLIIIALAINTFILSLNKPQVLRYSIVLTSTMVLIYNIAVFTMGGILTESISVISSVIGILRFRRETAHGGSDEK